MGIFKIIKGAFRRCKTFATGGGGILVFAILITIPPNLNAIELNQICTSGGAQCKINTNVDSVTNSSIFITGGDVGIVIDATIDNFTNYNTIKVGRGNQSFSFEDSGYIKSFTNYGTTQKMFWGGRVGIVTNYGTMSGIVKSDSDSTLTLDNQGIMRPTNDSWGRETYTHLQLSNGAKILIENYQIKVDTMAMTFNKFNGWSDNNSHLVISGSGVNFKDGDSRIILDFGDAFEFGEKYLIGKLVTDTSGTTYNELGVDFSRLIPKNDIYTLTQSGQYFIAKLAPEYSTIGNLYKSNVRTMNNFYTMSNSMIYPHKYKSKRIVRKRKVIRKVKKVSNLFNDSSLQNNSNAILSSLRENEHSEFSWQSTLESLESNESFAYKTDSNNINQTKRQSANRRMSQSKSTQSTQTIPSTLSNQNDKYYFVLTPFVAHNLFFESGRYNLSGLEYGFLTAFSGKITPSNALGAHFMMSYGNIGDAKDKEFSITNLNLNVGLNYKFDMIWDMYLKARGDFYYFLNQVKTLTMFDAIKPNTFGFGVSVTYGKDFNFGNGGILGIEGGIDYKALQSNTIELHDNTYQKNLYNLIYVDLGLNHNKYFNTNIGLWGINTALGIKGNITANKLSKSQIHINNLNRDINMVLDNDKILAYANISASYVLNHKDFDMEFSLAYYGNYGDRVISNGGGMEFRVVF